MVVISPQQPEKSAQLKQKNGYTYHILYDEENETAKQFGLAFILSEPLRPIHEAFNMDIPEHNGNNSFELPIPATYVINQQCEIIYAHINANWMDRAEPLEYLNILEPVKP